MTNETVKGFKDFTGKEAEKRAFVQEVIRRTFEKYNFEQVETPVIEYEEFVKSGNSNDEAISDIFKLQDKGKRNLALRYEFTFQLKRIANNKKLPYKRFQIGPVFRDEPVSGNRFRQFTQCDIDVVGSTLKEEAEILGSAKEILDTLKIKFKIFVNNRKLLNEILDEQEVKNKEEVLREIDKIDKLTEKEVRENLKKFGAENVLEIFKKPISYFKKYKAYSEIEELAKICKCYGVVLNFQPSLARGLSYYKGNVFEIKSDIKANENISINSLKISQIKETICAGGSYEVEGKPATGISFGLERLCEVTNIILNIEKILIASLEQDAKAISIAQKLRKQGKNVSIFYGKPSKALEYANSYGIKKVVFVGKKEVQQKKILVKDLKTGKEKLIVIGRKLGV